MTEQRTGVIAKRRPGGVAVVIATLAGVLSNPPAPAAAAQRPAGSAESARPGSQGRGVVLLPNGWKIAPAGRHLPVGDLPLALLESADGRYVIVTNNGYAEPTLTVVDVERFLVKSRLPRDHAWLGLTWGKDRQRLYSSGAGANTVDELTFSAGTLTAGRTFQLARPAPESFVGGVAVSPDGRRLYAVQVLGQRLSVLDLDTGGVLRTVELAAEPYTSLLSADGNVLFVSLWGGAKVLLFDAHSLEPRGEIVVGEHPNAMALTPDGSRLFVACANTNAVWVGTWPRAPPASR